MLAGDMRYLLNKLLSIKMYVNGRAVAPQTHLSFTNFDIPNTLLRQFSLTGHKLIHAIIGKFYRAGLAQ